MQFLNDFSDSQPDITIRIFSIEHDTDNLLTKEFLLQIYDIQSSLFKDLNITKDGDSLYSNDHNVLVYSPLDYWDNNRLKLLHSNSIIKTIELNGRQIKSLSSQPLNNIQMFAQITKSDGLIVSAQCIRLVSYYRNTEVVDKIIDENLKSIKAEFPYLNIFSELTDHNVNRIESKNHHLRFNVHAKFFSCIDFFCIYLLLPILLVQSILKVKRNKFIRSKLGLFAAFFVQLVLTSSASVTIVSFSDNYSELLQLPFPLLIFIPFSVTIINISRLILFFSDFATDISFIARVKNTINRSFPISTNFNLVVLVILNICRFFTHSECSRLYCSFSSLCIIFNYFLTYTYTLAILIVDMNNVELQDLIQNSEKVNEDMNESDSDLGNMIALNDNGKNSGYFGSDKKFIHLTRNYLTTRFLLFNVFCLLAIIPIVFQWTEGVSSQLPYENNNLLDIFINKRGFAYELLALNNNINNVSLEISSPVLLSTQTEVTLAEHKSAITISSTYDVFYFLEFISFLIFAVSILALMLKLLIDSEKNDEYSKTFSASKSSVLTNKDKDSLSSNIQSFQSKDLVKGHVLDIVKLCTSSCPFIVSVGIDHKILVWSPLKYPIPAPTQLPISAKFLPVTHVEMSDSGSAITVFSRSGEIKCWSRSSMSWVWTISFEELVNDIPLVSFFRKRTQVSNGRRKLVSRVSRHYKENVPSGQVPSSLQLPPSISPTTAASSNLQSGRRLSLDSNFNQSLGMKEPSNMEFILVLKNGTIISIECSTGKVDKAVLSDSALLCAKKLISPRVNDRIVAVKENGEFVVSTVINNKWRSRPVKIDASNYNKGKSLITPAALSKYSELSYSSSPSSLPQANQFIDENASNSDKKVDFVDDNLNDLHGIVMETVPFVGMIVRAFGSKCQLIDVQSGTVLKEWQICQFKINTFKVFHPEPSHCRFCGCASVASFSVAYTELETNSLIMHTFSIDNRAKNNICLRVERDSRETRCLGFASVTEHQHVLSNVEGWCPTDMNILMGVRRKDSSDRMAASSFSSVDDTLNSDDTENSILKSIFESGGIGLRRRKHNASGIKNSIPGARMFNGNGSDDTEKELKVDSIIRKTVFARSPKKDDANSTRRLSDIWEGWTMSADGQVRFYRIPDGSDSGLLIKKLGPVCKFGHKSLVVSFGNIMKVLYLGNDSLVEEDAPSDEDAASARYQSSSSLSFINRRRKLRMKKYDLTHSTNFEDSSMVSTELAA